MKHRTVPTAELFVFIINGHSQKNNEILFKIPAILSLFHSGFYDANCPAFPAGKVKSRRQLPALRLLRFSGSPHPP